MLSTPKRDAKDHEWKSKVWMWFLHLPLSEKAKVLSIEDKENIQLIQKMYQKKLEEGEGLFFAVDDGFEDQDDFNLKGKNNYIFTNKNDFCFSKMSCLDSYRICNYPESLLNHDRQLESFVRLCDTREYLDTMTVATNLLNCPQHFLYLMERSSRGGFLTKPCRGISLFFNYKIIRLTISILVEYKKKGTLNQWVWQAPAWFVGMGFYSLGTFIAHKIEIVRIIISTFMLLLRQISHLKIQLLIGLMDEVLGI